MKEGGYIRIIQCFLKPSLMIQQKEAPNFLTEYHISKFSPEGKAQVINREDMQTDPIYHLFMPKTREELGELREKTRLVVIYKQYKKFENS